MRDPVFRGEFERQNPSGTSPTQHTRLISIPACLRQSAAVENSQSDVAAAAADQRFVTRQNLAVIEQQARQISEAQRQLAEEQMRITRDLPELRERLQRAEFDTMFAYVPPRVGFDNPQILGPGVGGGAGIATRMRERDMLRVQVLDQEARERAIPDEAARLRGAEQALQQALTSARDAISSPVQVPASTPAQMLRPRAGVDPAEAAASLQAVAPTAEPRPVVGLSLVTPLTADAPEVAGTPCADAQSPERWPLDRRLVADALSVAIRSAEDRGQPPERIVVRVADTGVRGIGTYFALSLLAVDQESPSPPTGVPEQDWDTRRFGFAAEGPRASIFPYPPNEDRFHWHGTQVADLILGGAALREVLPPGTLQRLMGLNFAKLSERVAGGGPPRIDIVALQDAFSHRPSTFVLNASVGTEERLEPFIAVAGNNRNNILVVVAAGNRGHDLARSPSIHPAAYGGSGDLGRILITVGAHDPSLMRARFSNFSRRYVDLLAPGCAIPFRFGAELNTQLHGTSFAAPLVSFTAAAVRALGVSSPQRVKNHILRTTDFDPALERVVLSAGRLNVSKAILAVSHDVVQKPDGSLLPGTWLNRTVRIPCGAGPGFPLADARAVTVRNAGGRPSELRILSLDAQDRLDEPTYCPLPAVPVIFRPINSPDEVRLHWGDIIGIVPAALQR